ncbi:bromodomain and WD repeat-containing protein 3 [Anopheles cruzii]|uniref:bromodomain and WD repeat-containing protein 3 n=1 Tax=Anopheles cruzii TaxID=68878 RepID=UPI0022EC7476|nr:bromodomain and WD repeat-containing protein 3 [Anopheles cruzii]
MEDRSLVVAKVPIQELYFLIAKFLANGPLRETANVLVQELEHLDIFPRRLDWTGQEHRQTLAELERKYPHIGPQHLLEICSRVGPLLDKQLPPAVSGLISVLGAGRQSLLRTKETVSRPRQLVDYYTRVHDRPLSDVVNRNNTHNLVRVLYGRESAGPLVRHQAVPTSFYSKQNLQRRTLGHLSAVYCVLFDRTGKYIITGADDFLVKLWSAIDGRLLATFRGASAEITDIAINLDNTMLAAGSLDRILRVWDLQYGGPIAVLSGHTGMITSVNFCPSPKTDLRYLVTTSTDGSVAFWEYNTRGGKTTFCSKPTSYHEKLRPGQAQMICGSFSPGGIFLAAGSADHHVRVYLMSEDGPKRILETESHGDTVDSIQWAHAGLRFISGSKDGTALVWHFESQQWKSIRLNMSDLTQSCPPPTVDDGNIKLKVTMVSWDNTDNWVITAVNDHTIKVWNAHTGRLHRVLRGHTSEIYVLESHAKDSGVLLSAGHDGHLYIWDIVEGVTIASFINKTEDLIGNLGGGIYDAKWSPDGMMIAATDQDGHILMFGYGSGHEKLKRLPQELFFHTDYRPLIRDSALHVMDEQTQTMPHLMPPPFLVDIDGNPYPPALQRLVPGRENCPTDQLVPNISVENGGELQLQQQQQPQPQQLPAVAVARDGAAYSNIDRMIEALANRRVGGGGGGGAGAGAGGGGNGEQQPLPDELAAAMAPDSNNERQQQAGGNARNPPVPVAAGRNAAPQQQQRFGSVGNWHRAGAAAAGAAAAAPAPEDEMFKFHRRQYVRPMNYSLMVHLKQRVYWAGVQEQDVYRREMRRRPVMINTANGGALGGGQSLNGGPSGSRRRGAAGNRPLRRAGNGAGGGPVPAYRTRAVRENEPLPEPPEEDEHEHEQNESSSSESSHSDDSTAIEEELESGSSSSDSQSSDYSDWVSHEPGRNLEPPKRSKRKHVQRRAYSPPDPDQAGPSNAPAEGPSGAAASDTSATGTATTSRRSSAKIRKIPLTRDGEIPEQFRPPEWLSEVIPRKAPYYPQMGDEVVYFRQGHQRYLEAVRTKSVYSLGNRCEPWATLDLRAHEVCKVIGIKYEIRPPRLCCLKLGIINGDGELTDRSFAIKYHDMPDVLDFLVLKQTFDTSMIGRTWGPGDRFRCMIEDVWWTGQIESRNQLSGDFPDSPFMCFRVRWDNGEYELMSPWDLEPVDESRQPDEIGGAVPVLAEELQATLYQPKTEEWPRGDRDASCRRIIAGLEQVMGLAIADLFLAPVDLNLYPEYAFVVEYPIDLNTIKSRFENHFYRRVTSAQFDVRYLATNAEKFNESHSTIVRNARIITDLCLRILSDLNEIDVPAVYHQLVDTYLSSDSEVESHRPGHPSSSGGAAGGAGPSGSGSNRRPPAGSRRSRRLVPEGDWRVDCREILEMIWQCDDSEPFREPVDTIEHPDYLQIIDTPMDLRTIKEDLLGGNYDSPLDFYKDMKLIFQNSRNYNTNKRSRIYSMTLRLSTLFEANIKQIIHMWKLTRKRGKAGSKRSSGSAGGGASGSGWMAASGSGASNNGLPSTKRRRNAERHRRGADDDGPGPSSSNSGRRGLAAATALGSSSGLNTSGGSSRTVASHTRSDDDDDDDDEEEEEEEGNLPTRPSKNRTRNGGMLSRRGQAAGAGSNGVSSSSNNVIDPLSRPSSSRTRSRRHGRRSQDHREQDDEEEEEVDERSVGSDEESEMSTSGGDDSTSLDDSDSDDDDDDDSTGVPVSHRADYDSGEVYNPYKKRRKVAHVSSKKKKKVHRRRKVSSTTKRKNGMSSVASETATIAAAAAASGTTTSRATVRQDAFGAAASSMTAGPSSSSSRSLRNGPSSFSSFMQPATGDTRGGASDGRNNGRPKTTNKRSRRAIRNPLAASSEEDDDDDDDETLAERSGRRGGPSANGPAAKRNRGRYESDHSYHKERPKTARIVSDTENEEEVPRSTRGSVRRAQAEWGKSEDDSLDADRNADDDDDDDDDDDEAGDSGTPVVAAVVGRSRRIADEDEDDQHQAGPSSRSTGAFSSAATGAAASDRRMRTRKPVISDREQTPEEASNISKRGSTQRAAAARSHTYHSSRTLRRVIVETTTETNGTSGVMVRRTEASTSTAIGRRLRGTTSEGVMAATSTSTPPPHTVDHNYGEPGPSSRGTSSATARAATVAAGRIGGGTPTTPLETVALLRRTRNRTAATLSRHQRNPDELDQAMSVTTGGDLVDGGLPNESIVHENHHGSTDHHNDDPEEDDDDDDMPLRAPQGGMVGRQLRNRRHVARKRKPTVSFSHDEADGKEDEQVDGSSDSDSDSDDNTPLHTMAAALATTAAPTAWSRARVSRSQTTQQAASSSATTAAAVAATTMGVRTTRGTPKKAEQPATASTSRTRRKERYTSDEEYELPGTSSGRSTRNLKRLRYNEESEEDDDDDRHHRGRRRFGSGTHRSQRNPPAQRNPVHAHDDEDDDDDDEDIARALANIRQRSRRLTDASPSPYGSTQNSHSSSGVVVQQPAPQQQAAQHHPPPPPPPPSQQQQQPHHPPYHPPSRHQSSANTNQRGTGAADPAANDEPVQRTSVGDGVVAGGGLRQRRVPRHHRHRHSYLSDADEGSEAGAVAVAAVEPSPSARATRARERDHREHHQSYHHRHHRLRNGDASEEYNNDGDLEDDENGEDDGVMLLTSVSSRGRVRRINPRVSRMFRE